MISQRTIPYVSKKQALILCLILFLGTQLSCSSNNAYMIDLMPTPRIYDENRLHPFSDLTPIDKDGTIELIYATDRMPAGPDDREKYYKNKGGSVVRLGVGRIKLGNGNVSWDEMKKISLLKNRTQSFPLKVERVREYGILDSSISELDLPEIKAQKTSVPSRKIADMINEKLDRSNKKDVYIYVHGFKVNFENPLLVASELWHYLGYEGVFIPFAWPSTPSLWSYAADVETTEVSARNLRILIQYLAKNTNARKIHIVGYSAGTRLVVYAMHDLALIFDRETRQEIDEDLSIGHVLLVGSDMDRNYFIHAIFDGMLKVTDNFSVYISEGDKALSWSKLFYSRKRLGQSTRNENIREEAIKAFREREDLDFIDVTDAEGSMSGNGHVYFRRSPWASSDILTTLMFGLGPEQRGLVRGEDDFIWSFPPKYVDNLKTILAKENPALRPLEQDPAYQD